MFNQKNFMWVMLFKGGKMFGPRRATEFSVLIGKGKNIRIMSPNLNNRIYYCALIDARPLFCLELNDHLAFQSNPSSQLKVLTSFHPSLHLVTNQTVINTHRLSSMPNGKRVCSVYYREHIIHRYTWLTVLTGGSEEAAGRGLTSRFHCKHLDGG